MSGKDVRDALGSNIKLLRFHRELSQADLAEKAGISITFLSDIERGNKWPYPDTLANLAQALKAPVYELFKMQDDVSDEAQGILRQFSEDVSRVMKQSLETVYKKYNVL